MNAYPETASLQMPSPAKFERRGVGEFSRGRPTERSVPPVLTEIVFDHHASAEHTVIEVLTADRPGLLFTLAQALHEIGVSIHLAKINTEGSRVIDVFYVTDTQGRKLALGEATERVRAKLAQVLEAVDPPTPLARSAAASAPPMRSRVTPPGRSRRESCATSWVRSWC